MMMMMMMINNVCPQLFDGKEGRSKYPRRWIMLPPLF